MTILRTCPKQEAASSTCCSRAMDVIAQGLSRPARRMGDDAFSAARLGATQRLWDSCCNGACDLSSAQVAGTGLAHACSNGGHGWSQPNVSSLRDQCPHNLHWQVRIRRICGARLSRGRDASRRRWRSLALWLLCEPLLLCAPCATAA